MASGRVLSHLLRLSSIPLLKPAAFSSLRYPSPVPFSRLKPAGFLLSRAVQYANPAPVADDAAHPAKDPSAGPSGKITDEFTGGGAIGQVCQVDGTEEIVREQRVLNTGSPITYATSAVPPAKAPASPSAGPSSRITDEFIGGGAIGHICQVDGTEEIVREPRVLNTGSPITYATSAAAAATASKAPVSPSAGPSGKITDEFTGAGAIQQRHAGGDTYSDRDGVDGGTYSYCLTFSDIMYGEEYFIYGSDDDSDDII